MPSSVRRHTTRLMALTVVACWAVVGATAGAAASPTSPPAPSQRAAPPSSAADPLSDLVPCDFQPGVGDKPWLCGSISVPLDRADQQGGTLDLNYAVLPHADQSVPAGLPLFATPGGPGGTWYDDYVLYAMQPELHAHHDIVTLDPRGTGLSGVIDCPGLQQGARTHDELVAAVTACGRLLGTASGRYGAGDRAMDVEAVRAELGYPLIDYYGASYGGVDAQAYAARFPERLHSLVLDSTFPVTDPDHVAWTGGPYSAAALVHVMTLQCKRDPSCAALTPDPEQALLDAVKQLRDHPVDGQPANHSAAPVHLDDLAMAWILTGANPAFLVSGALALARGDAQPLINLAAGFRPVALPETTMAPTEFSAGANAAGWCNDEDTAWNRADPVPARQAALDAYLAALPADAFAPFSKDAWRPFQAIDLCLNWPAPVNFTPAVPAGTTMPSVPVLILSGDEDNGVPLGYSQALLDEFPQATLVRIAGAGHPTMSLDGPCVPSIVGGFLETGTVPDTSCAGTPG